METYMFCEDMHLQDSVLGIGYFPRVGIPSCRPHSKAHKYREVDLFFQDLHHPAPVAVLYALRSS
jgi:hypothetical protein